MTKTFGATCLALTLTIIGVRAEPTRSVTIENSAFSPAEIVVKAGTEVVFVNRDRIPHSVLGTVDQEVRFRSREQLDEDETFAVVLDQPGKISVHCGLHPGMTSHLEVTP